MLLTDGDDTESAATLVDAADAARSEHARVFVVGLPGAEINRQNLRELVEQTGGEFVQVRSIGQLRRVYGELASELGGQYILSYTSQLRGTGRPVNVALSVAGLTATQRYTIPPIARTHHEAVMRQRNDVCLAVVGKLKSNGHSTRDSRVVGNDRVR